MGADAVPLARRLLAGESGLLLYGMTPPRVAAAPDDVQRVADLTAERLARVQPDGVILYDIDDEPGRTGAERPFPYLPTQDPADFLDRHLTGWRGAAIVYRCVSKYAPEQLTAWLQAQDADRVLSVFVGAATTGAAPRTTLAAAQALRADLRPDLALGGVAIPERHTAGNHEHERLIAKQAAGCSFFVSQVVYDVEAAKNLVSDYRYRCEELGLGPRPMIFTLSVCGSLRTLEFLTWLGVDVPRWLQNDLRHSADTLADSYDACLRTARELARFCTRLGVPFGFNVESVSVRKAEIEATVALAEEVRAVLGRRT